MNRKKTDDGDGSDVALQGIGVGRVGGDSDGDDGGTRRTVGLEKWDGLALTTVLLLATWPVLIEYSKGPDGDHTFAIGTLTLTVEAAKLLICCWACPKSLGDAVRFAASHRWFAVPGFLYAVNNSLVYFVMQSLPPPPYLLLDKLKIATTAVLFRVFLRRPLSPQQWCSVILLTLGTSLQHVGELNWGTSSAASPVGDSPSDGGDAAGPPLHLLALVLLVTVNSGAAAVVSEATLKQDGQTTSIHLQQFALYSYSVTACAASVAVQDYTVFWRFFEGWTGWTWLIVLNEVLIGLAVARVLKEQSSLAKVYIQTVAMVLAMVVSIFLGQYVPNVLFFYSLAIILIATVLYYSK